MLPKIPNNSGKNSNSDIYNENNAVKRSLSENDAVIIQAANQIRSLLSVFQNYGITLDRQNDTWSNKISCPFPSHKAGQEKTGSFNYNFQQDRFHCFGCGKSGRAVEFISYKEDIAKCIVAEQIIKDAGGYIPANIVLEESSDPKIDKLLYNFSLFIFEIISKNKNNKIVLQQVDKITEWVDGYLIKAIPKRKVVVEELNHRLIKAKELLAQYNI